MVTNRQLLYASAIFAVVLAALAAFLFAGGCGTQAVKPSPGQIIAGPDFCPVPPRTRPDPDAVVLGRLAEPVTARILRCDQAGSDPVVVRQELPKGAWLMVDADKGAGK